ncbi:hypothetical protein IWW36_002978 [Coemansia brasiliensis]|uniref:Serine carboxypeptidase S28-domain-containing protein n=1 Tax=Coemansia brasiliensis TaxID=2650707 RepID=A0A9W8IAZ9_9FUNG|nr:hypothetical protein IWW36_002978 [Coemansia brasiliensis]
MGTPIYPRGTDVPASSTQYWFTQPIDHFGGNNGTWQQQYLVNATFYKPGGPIFISTPGETPLSTRYVDGTYPSQLAQQMSALVVSVEHRFFGRSNPMPDLSGESLQFMTIENVLEDFAQFLAMARSNPDNVFPIPVFKNAKVIFFGGSYSGNVAAWMRAKYPNLVEGAWSSSAILYARLQNYQFDQGYGRHLQALGCAEQFSQAIEAVDSILMSNDITSLQQKLGIPALSAQDTGGLLAGLGILYSLSPIYKGQDLVDSNVCSHFANSTVKPIDAYAQVIKSAIAQMGISSEGLVQMGDTSYGLDNYALGQVDRTWYYMCCTWFGNWQVAPPADLGLSRYRSQLVDLSYFQPNCQRKFGSTVTTPVDVDAYNAKWFDILKGASNIYYTSGSLDIWQDTTVLASTGNLLSSTSMFKINGASHVQDLKLAQDNDLDTVKQARAIGNMFISRWLKQTC